MSDSVVDGDIPEKNKILRHVSAPAGFRYYFNPH